MASEDSDSLGITIEGEEEDQQTPSDPREDKFEEEVSDPEVEPVEDIDKLRGEAKEDRVKIELLGDEDKFPIDEEFDVLVPSQYIEKPLSSFE